MMAQSFSIEKKNIRFDIFIRSSLLLKSYGRLVAYGRGMPFSHHERLVTADYVTSNQWVRNKNKEKKTFTVYHQFTINPVLKMMQ